MRIWGLIGAFGLMCVVQVARADCPELLQNNEFSASLVAPWSVTSDPFDLASAAVSTDPYKTLNISVNNIAKLNPVQLELSQPVSITKNTVYNVSLYSSGLVGARLRVKSAAADTSYGLDQSFNSLDGNGTLRAAFQATASDANARFSVSYTVPADQYLFVKFDSLFMEDTTSPACDLTGGTGGTIGGGSGGISAGGTGTAGVSAGGTASGGAHTGGVSGGGAANGGANSSGAPSGGMSTGGESSGAGSANIAGEAGANSGAGGAAGVFSGGGDAGEGPSGGLCTPGRQLACACPGTATQGAQACNAQGTGYGECSGCPSTTALSPDKSGCSCRLASPPSTHGAAWLLLAVGAVLGARRRSRARLKAGMRQRSARLVRVAARFGACSLALGLSCATLACSSSPANGASASAGSSGGPGADAGADSNGGSSHTSAGSGNGGVSGGDAGANTDGNAGEAGNAASAGDAGALNGGSANAGGAGSAGASAGDGGSSPGGAGSAGASSAAGSAGAGNKLVATSIAMGPTTSCAVLNDHTAECWGHDAYSQVGDGQMNDRLAPSVPVLGVTTAIGIAVSDSHGCALLSTGQINCWGLNTSGQLGNGKTLSSPAPVRVSGIENAISVAVSATSSCAILNGGSVQCWGANESGQLGDGGVATQSSVPVSIPGITNAVELALGYFATCARVSAGSVYCWGGNQHGALGRGAGPTEYHSTPALVTGISTAVSVAISYQHACAALSDGSVRCWGEGESGKLGNNSAADSAVPVNTLQITTANAVTAGMHHSCALLKNGSMTCWGNGAYGALGSSAGGTAFTQVPVTGVSSASAIASGEYDTCALLQGGSVQCWGYNLYGRLGLSAVNSPTYADHATAVAGF